MKKNIIWLASYPKSGNTWFRAFLSALLNEEDDLDINNLIADYFIGNSDMFEEVTNLNASELSLKEVDSLKPEVIRYVANQSEGNLYFKIHEKFRYQQNDLPIIPIDKTLVVLYFVRNPLDIAVSYAHHDHTTIKTIINRLNNNHLLGYNRNRSFFNIHETLGTWSEHVLSWLDNTENIHIEVIRYEDMHLKPLETFTRAVKAIGLAISSKDIENAIKNSSFAVLKAKEKKVIFREKNPNSVSFFRKGTIGSWQDKLSKQDVKKIIESHHVVMRRLGYLNKQGELIF